MGLAWPIHALIKETRCAACPLSCSAHSHYSSPYRSHWPNAGRAPTTRLRQHRAGPTFDLSKFPLVFEPNAGQQIRRCNSWPKPARPLLLHTRRHYYRPRYTGANPGGASRGTAYRGPSAGHQRHPAAIPGRQQPRRTASGRCSRGASQTTCWATIRHSGIRICRPTGRSATIASIRASISLHRYGRPTERHLYGRAGPRSGGDPLALSRRRARNRRCRR